MELKNTTKIQTTQNSKVLMNDENTQNRGVIDKEQNLSSSQIEQISDYASEIKVIKERLKENEKEVKIISFMKAESKFL